MRQRGTISYFQPDRGFGFITPSGRRPREADIFVHISAALEIGVHSIAPGDVFEFDTREARDGRPEACNLRLLASATGGVG